ncbi:MAG: LysM peptidoglycan-binding domain-containing protein [Chloroflexota bacterium]|nr:LysM peptidoglycan-binding domain-containing protein [Chloroflexota bacterium]
MATTKGATVTKAKIVVVDEKGNAKAGKSITCMYNPETLQFSRSASWDKKSIPQESHSEHSYKGGEAATLSVKLFFDTTRDIQEHGVKVSAGTDVRNYTDFLFSLTEVEQDTGHPPYCRFEWGGKFYFVKGFLKSVSADYTLFLPDGTPIRAEVSVSFEETDSEEELDDQAQNPTTRSLARKTWIVREGERLDWIAYQEYGKAANWRHIAEVNGIDNPLVLRPGQVLKLTPLV